ncbi:unnamed protein product [Ambrosiozyma monospora]|uniref:Unnamed protein product n=1 Tax=Ambrosiozyma monospora TaxID=43982 RepID=A0A9W6WLB4_AMBMO|nr:unnamed protein product [Ambrosiozyma monospora]
MCRDFPKMTPQYLDQVVHGATQPYKSSNNQTPVVHAISVPTSQLKAQYLDYEHHPVVHAMCRDFPKMTPQ